MAAVVVGIRSIERGPAVERGPLAERGLDRIDLGITQAPKQEVLYTGSGGTGEGVRGAMY